MLNDLDQLSRGQADCKNQLNIEHRPLFDLDDNILCGHGHELKLRVISQYILSQIA